LQYTNKTYLDQVEKQIRNFETFTKMVAIITGCPPGTCYIAIIPFNTINAAPPYCIRARSLII
jgi:hypothetical protein